MEIIFFRLSRAPKNGCGITQAKKQRRLEEVSFSVVTGCFFVFAIGLGLLRLGFFRLGFFFKKIARRPRGGGFGGWGFLRFS